MSKRYPREHYRADKRAKKKYSSRKEAKQALGRSKSMEAYSCGVCGAWHIGHPRRAKKQRGAKDAKRGS